MTPFDRVPLRSPIDGKASKLTTILVTPSISFADTYQLPTGRFEFFELIGITEDEAQYARDNGSEVFFDKLVAGKGAPVTDPERSSVLA